MNSVVLGGTSQKNNYNMNVDVDDRRHIYEGCLKLNPTIKDAEIIKDVVGLRPGRTQVRLERDFFVTSNHNMLLKTLHCFVILALLFFYREW